jgi:hypothetical protein
VPAVSSLGVNNTSRTAASSAGSPTSPTIHLRTNPAPNPLTSVETTCCCQALDAMPALRRLADRQLVHVQQQRVHGWAGAPVSALAIAGECAGGALWASVPPALLSPLAACRLAKPPFLPFDGLMNCDVSSRLQVVQRGTTPLVERTRRQCLPLMACLRMRLPAYWRMFSLTNGRI